MAANVASSHTILDRARERRVLQGLFEGARRSDGGALLVRGEPGIGKSSLLAWVAACAEGMVAIGIRGFESERHIPYAGLHQLMLATERPVDELPITGRGNAGSPDWAGSSADAELVLGTTVLALVSQVGRTRPLLCCVDDADLLDEASAAAIAFAARRLDHVPVAMVCAATDPPCPARHLFEGLAEITIRGLSRSAARALLEREHPHMRLDVRDSLIEAARGNPLALLDMPRALTPEQRRGEAALPLELPVGRQLRQRVLRGLEQLPTDTRRLLLLIAAEPTSDAARVERAARAWDIEPATAALPARDAGVLHGGEGLEFRHPFVRSTVYQSAVREDLIQAHGALGNAVDPVADAADAAFHRAATARGPSERLAGRLARAVDASADRAPILRARLLERAAWLSPDPRNRRSRQLTAAEAFLTAGDVGRARLILGEIEPRLTRSDELARGRRLAAEIALAEGRVAEAQPLLLRAARSFADRNSHGARDVYLRALRVAVQAGGFNGSGITAETAASALEGQRSRTVGTEDVIREAFARRLMGTSNGDAARMREVTRRLGGEHRLEWMDFATWAAAELWDDEAIWAMSERWVALAREAGRRAELGRALLSRAVLYDVPAGRLEDAQALIVQARRTLAAARVQHSADCAASADVFISAWRGRQRRVRRLASIAHRYAAQRGHGLHAARVEYALAVLENSLGRYDAAVTHGQQAAENDAFHIATLARPELVEAAARTGDHELAHAQLAQLAASVAGSETHWGRGMLARGTALAWGNDPDAEIHYRRAIHHLRQGRFRLEYARARLVYGEWLRRQRRVREARAELEVSRAIFAATGAHAFAERAMAEERASGSREGVISSERARLTPQEERIVRAAATGATNAEIGRRLSISARTVEYHLHKVFRTLNIGSRVELVRVAQALESGADGDADVDTE